MDLEPTQAIPLSGGEEDDDETDEEPLGADKQPVCVHLWEGGGLKMFHVLKSNPPVCG